VCDNVYDTRINQEETLPFKLCSLCEEAGEEPEPATHTYYSQNNTMTWCCDRHADQLLREASVDPAYYVGSKLLPTVEESDPERRARHARSNLLRFSLRTVA
jgi:hypothetical protein